MSKKIISFMLVLLMILSMSTMVLANDLLDPGSITAESTAAATSIMNFGGKVLGVVQVVAISVATIMLIVLAIKYISAAPNDKAEIKKHAIVYVVGAVVLFGASGILQIIKSFAGTIKG